MFSIRNLLLVFAGICALAPEPGEALVVAGDDSQSTTAPADDFGFENIGQVFDSADGIYASGVYLGNGWMISAYHVVRGSSAGTFVFGNVVLDGASYAVDPASGVRLETGSNPADLALFHLTSIPTGLDAISLSNVTPVNNTPLIMAGNGYGRAASQTQWTVDDGTNPPTWTETTGTGDHQGYYWMYSQTVRWGTNNLANFGNPSLLTSDVDDGFGTTTMLLTNFSAGLNGEAQATGGDSGGGIFYKNAGQWQLLGVMLATAGFPGQPSTTEPSSIDFDSSVFGDETYAADLSAYRSQIQEVIPEPGSGLLAIIGGAWTCLRRPRTRNIPA